MSSLISQTRLISLWPPIAGHQKIRDDEVTTVKRRYDTCPADPHGRWTGERRSCPVSGGSEASIRSAATSTSGERAVPSTVTRCGPTGQRPRHQARRPPVLEARRAGASVPASLKAQVL